MPNIFYAGGTVDKKISSVELIDGIKANGIKAEHMSDRKQIADRFLKARPEDMIVIMGAIDDTLTEFARVYYRN